MNCPVCKADNPATSKFCNECGIRLEFQCPYCASPTAAGAKFCTECGSSLDFRCAQCNAVNRQGAKFCQQCGVRLVIQCFTCGATTPPGSRFCQQCGGRLERRCSGCGSPIVFGARFCNGCGMALVGTEVQTQPLPLITLPSRPAAAPPAPSAPVAPAAAVAPPPIAVAPPPSASAVQPPPPIAPQPVAQAPVVVPPPSVVEAPPVIEAPVAAAPPPVVEAPPVPPDVETPAAPAPIVAPSPVIEPVVAQAPVAAPAPAASPPVAAPPVAAAAPAPPIAVAPAEPEAPRKPEDERRLVTVLFGDVSGFTAMSEKMDAEEMKLIMDRCLKQLADQVFKFEGTVDKFEGDLIMAVWGAPTAHEDDAERAVLAALDMQRILTEFSANLYRRRGFTLRMRIGVNTGEVISGVVAAGRDKDYTVMGDVVNTASRFEGAAEVGTVMVGEKTWQLTKHLIEYEALEPITVKGKVEPLTVFKALSVRADRGLRRGVAGLESPMVGRTGHLVNLLAEYQAMVPTRQPHMATILGVPGIGKSRLLAEYESALKLGGNEFTWCKGRCVPYGQGIAFYPLAEILKGFLGIKESDSLEYVQERLLDGIGEIVSKARLGQTIDPSQVDAVVEVREEARQLAHRLGYAIGVSYPDADLQAINPANLKDELFWAWRRFLSDWASIQPLVFVVEDVHWADPVVLDLVSSVSRSLDGAPIQFLCLSRPELMEERPDWADAPNAMLIKIDPLSLEQSIELVDNLLSPNLLSRAWKERVAKAASGVPFFVEEFLRTLIEEEQIHTGAAGWGPKDAERLPELPDSIFATLFSRLDRLPAGQKNLLQRASVVGGTFWDSSLRYPQPALGSDGVAIGELQAKGWLEQHSESAFLGDSEYGFVNYMVRESAYKGLTRTRRSQEHHRVARWLEERVGDRVEEFLELLAYHYGQGALQAIEDDESDNTPVIKAISYGWRAAERSRMHHAFNEALTRYDDTLRLVERLTGDPSIDIDGRSPATIALDVLLARAQVKEPLGQYDAALADIDRALTEAIEQHLTAIQAQGYTLKARLQRLQAHSDDAADSVQKAIGLYQLTHDTMGEAQALTILGEIRSDKAELEAFESTMRQALVLAESSGVQWLEARALNLLGISCIYQGKMAEALEHLRGSRDLFQATGDRRGIATSLATLGRVEHATGDSTNAITHVEEAYAIFHEMGDQPMRVASLVTLGQLHLERGNLGPCRLYSQTALELAKTLGQHAQAVRATLSLAQAEIAEGVGPNLVPQLLEARDLSQSTNQTAILPEVYRMLAQAEVALADPVEGERYARLGREVVEAEDHYSQGTTWYALALTLAAQPGRDAEAEEAFHHAIECLEAADEAFEIGDSHLAYAVFLMAHDRPTEAMEHLVKAYEAFETLETKDRLARVEELRARLEAMVTGAPEPATAAPEAPPAGVPVAEHGDTPAAPELPAAALVTASGPPGAEPPADELVTAGGAAEPASPPHRTRRRK